MHEIYITLILGGLREIYQSEAEFYEQQLGISKERWDNWKKGKTQLSAEENQKVKNIFSDYEWMLLQKILRQTIIYPEKRQVAVLEYKKMKIKLQRRFLCVVQ